MAGTDVSLIKKLISRWGNEGLQVLGRVPTSSALRRALLKGPWGIRPCVHAATWGRHHQSDTLEGLKLSHNWTAMDRSPGPILYFHTQRDKSPAKLKFRTQITEMDGASCLPPLNLGSPRPTRKHDLDPVKSPIKHTSMDRLRFEPPPMTDQTNPGSSREPWCITTAVTVL